MGMVWWTLQEQQVPRMCCRSERSGDPDAIGKNHYYAFGMAFEGAWLQNDASIRDNKYQYNGKEFNDDFGLNWNDYGARWYDAAIGRWGQIDPLTDEQQPWTPYHYVYDNPIRYTDPDGRMPGDPPGEGGCCTRFFGGLRAVGGALQVAGGAALILAPEPTGLTKAGGVVAVGHGADDFQAGIRQMWTGENTESLTYSATKSTAQALGASEQTAGRIATGTDIGLGLVGGGGAATKGVEAVQVARTESALTQMAGTAKINATARTGLVEGQKGFGTAAHTDFKSLVDARGLKNVATEQSFLNGRSVGYGTSGSSRANAVLLNSNGTVKRVFDFKTGSSVLSPTQSAKYINNANNGLG